MLKGLYISCVIRAQKIKLAAACQEEITQTQLDVGPAVPAAGPAA